MHAGPSETVLPEDIPEEVLPLLPGIQYCLHLTLEPVQAPEAAFKALHRTAKAVAKATRGVVLDPQTDTVHSPSGLRRYLPPQREKAARVDVLEMTWWFEHARLVDRAAIEEFLSALRANLPEAMPRRYGLYEPPQHELAKAGHDHLVTFLTEHMTDGVVWYATAPVAYVSISLKAQSGWHRMGGDLSYRCNRVSIMMDAAALSQPGWKTALRRAWMRLSRTLQPFYGDVRTCGGYVRRGRGFGCDGQTEDPPTQSWWWKGIPPRLGHAVVLGEPYVERWPTFRATAEQQEGLCFASTSDWSTSEDLTTLIGEPPPEQAMEFMPHKHTVLGRGTSTKYPETYPEGFPFKRP